MKLFIGLMSGTSMDGIDAALLDVHAQRSLGALIRPYGQDCQRLLQSTLQKPALTPGELAQLSTIIGREFAEAALELLKQTHQHPKDIVAIGSHGQTICHDARALIPYTVQLGCAHTLAELTGITVVSDFRSRDLVIGGQGAPFAPLYHQALFGALEQPMAVVNIGGITNITYLSELVTGHDVGPGNCLMDAWIQSHSGQHYDQNGAWAATGEIIWPLLNALLDDPYFKASPPKSLGKEYFSTSWLARHLKADYAPEDVQATLLTLSAKTLADDIKKSRNPLKRLVICGGGVHNERLVQVLIQHCGPLPIESSSVHGLDPDHIEAMMFAWLAEKTLTKTPLDFKAITGSTRSAVYGAIYAGGLREPLTSEI